MIRKLTATFALLTMLVVPSVALVPSSVMAQTPKQAACEGVGLTGGNCGPGGERQIGDTVKSIINILSAVVGVAAVIMIIIGGFKYITSAGDTNKITGAKQTVTYAIIGLIIVALAQVIVRFVLTNV